MTAYTRTSASEVMQTALTQLHMQIEFLRRMEKTAVCGLSGFKFTKRNEESFSSAAAEPQLTELSHRACGIKHNNPSEAVHICWVTLKPEPEWC